MDKWEKRFMAMAKLVASWSKDPSTGCGAEGRLVLSLPRWHRQALSTESEERLLMALAPLGIEQLEIRGEVKGD